jgi:type II secretion system protein L
MPAKVPRGESARLLANAIEDKLLREPDSQHFVMTGPDQGDVTVLVTARERLREIVRQFAGLGRPLSRLYSELQVAPFGTDGLHLTLDCHRAILRSTENHGIEFDADPDNRSPPQILARLVEKTAEADGVTLALIIHCADDEPPDVTAWGAALGIEVSFGAAYRWYAVEPSSDNLLTGEFAPRHRRRAWLTKLRPALMLVVAVFVADLLLGLIQLGWWHHQLATREDEVAQLFRKALPNTPVVDPAFQVQRQLDVLRAPLGQLRSDDALALLAAVSDVLGSEGGNAIQSLHYDDDRLSATLAPSWASRAEAIADALRMRGFVASCQTAADGAVQIALHKGKRR